MSGVRFQASLGLMISGFSNAVHCIRKEEDNASWEGTIQTVAPPRLLSGDGLHDAGFDFVGVAAGAI